MSRLLPTKLVLLVCLVFSACLPLAEQPPVAAAPAQPGAMLAAPVDVDHPLMFIANSGQFDPAARFVVQGGETTLFVADDALWLTVIDQRSPSSGPSKSAASAGPGAALGRDESHALRPFVRGSNIKLSFVGANPRPVLEPLGQLDTTISYLRGPRAQWRPNVAAWAGVRYRNLYPGIDLVLSGRNGQLEQRMLAQPGADLSAVRLRIEGADAQRVAGNALELTLGAKTVALPLLQLAASAGSSLDISSGPQLDGATIAMPFAQQSDVQPAQTTQAANVLTFSSLLGGGADDLGRAIAVASNGATYVAGETFSIDFPHTTGAFDTSCGTDGACNFDSTFFYWDAFIAKLNAAGSGLAYATFLGGQGDDGAYDIAVDSSGAAYLTGYTISSDFPIANTLTGSSFDNTCGTDGFCNFDGTYSYYDGFLAKLSANGSTLIYSTYFGGANGDWGNALALNSANEAYITGRTYAPDFPTTSGAFDTTCGTDGSCDLDSENNLYFDSFVIRFDSECTCPIYSTFIGGANVETGIGIAVDSAGAAYVTGNTASDNFPVSSNGYDTNCGVDGQCDPLDGLVYFDGFVLKLLPDGSDRAYATYFGGSNGDGGNGIAVSSSGEAYVTGYTYSAAGFPVVGQVLDETHEGLLEGFALKLKPNGNELSYSTYLGGTTDDQGNDIAVDSSGNAYIVGQTAGDFPTTVNAYSSFFNGATDAFALKLNGTASKFMYSSYLGGSGNDVALGVAVNTSGNLYLTGITSSGNFPTTAGAYDRSYAGGICGSKPNDYPCADTFAIQLNPGTVAFSPLVSMFTPMGLLNAVLGTGVIPPPPPQLCDQFEPNDSRKTNPKKITLGTPLQAKICKNDSEDNYFFDLERNTSISVTLDVSNALKGKTVFYVYYQSQTDPYANAVGRPCENGAYVAANRLTANCGILGPDRYVVRIYTRNAATDFDNLNAYNLLVIGQ